MDYLGTQLTDQSVNTIKNDVFAYRKTGASRALSLAINCSPATTLVGVANQIRVWPWVITRKITISSIINEVTTAVAGSTFRAGIYTDNDFYPGTLVAGSDTGTVDSAATGAKTRVIAVPFALTPGLYWVALNSSANATLRAIPPAAIAPVLGVPTSLGAAPFTTGISVAFTYAAMPASFPATGSSFFQNTAAPLTAFVMA